MTSPARKHSHYDFPQMSSTAKTTWLPCALIVIIGALVYANSIHCPFVFDDQYSIVDNRYIVHPWPITQAVQSPPQSSVAGRPVSAYSLALNYAVNGLDVRIFHLTNILIHLLCGLALFGVIHRTLLLPCFGGPFHENAALIACATSILWLVHPLQTESIAYIIQRTEALAALFYLTTFYCFIRATQNGKSLLFSLLAVVSCGLAMGSKETAITAPFLILVFDRIYIAGKWRNLRSRWPLHLALAATWIILYMLIRNGPRSDSAGFSMRDLTPIQYAKTQFGVILHYLRLTVFPSTLCIDYTWPDAVHPADWMPQMLAIAALLAATIVLLWRAPRFGFLPAAFFVILSPSSTFVPIADAAFEHRMYLPLAPLSAMFVIAVFIAVNRCVVDGRNRILRPTILTTTVWGLIATCLAARTVIRNTDYASAWTLWQSVLTINPSNPRAFVTLGNFLLKQKNFDQADQMYRRAMEIDPDYPSSYIGRAGVLVQQGRFQEGLEFASQVIQKEPSEPEALRVAALALTRLGRMDEAAKKFKTLLAMNPLDPDADFNLACIYDEMGRGSDAESHYLSALRMMPDDANASRQLADLYFRTNQSQKAIEWYQHHLKLAPPTTKVLNRLATAMVQANRLPEAAECFQKAIKLDPNQAPVHLNLGNTLQRLGRTQQAIAEYEAALKLDPNMTPAKAGLDRARRTATSQP